MLLCVMNKEYQVCPSTRDMALRLGVPIESIFSIRLSGKLPMPSSPLKSADAGRELEMVFSIILREQAGPTWHVQDVDLGPCP